MGIHSESCLMDNLEVLESSDCVLVALWVVCKLVFVFQNKVEVILMLTATMSRPRHQNNPSSPLSIKTSPISSD